MSEVYSPADARVNLLEILRAAGPSKPRPLSREERETAKFNAKLQAMMTGGQHPEPRAA